jgi:hypothetical protein
MSTEQAPAATVYFALSMSLRRLHRPRRHGPQHGHDPTYKDWARKWSALQEWVVTQRSSSRNPKLGDDGETGPDDDRARHLFERTGVTIMGKRMFDGGERFWPDGGSLPHPGLRRHPPAESPWDVPAAPPSTSSTTGSRAP